MLYNQIQGSLWGELARRLFGGARVHTVAPEMGVQVDLFGRPELWALHAGSLLIGAMPGLAAGGAGTRSIVALSGIPVTREIFILDRILLSPGTTEQLVIAWSSEELGTSTGNLVGADSRRFVTTGGSAPTQFRIRTRNNAALGSVATEVSRVICLVNTVTVFEGPIVIGPGWSLRIYPTADNVALNSLITFVGRARSCTPDELAVL